MGPRAGDLSRCGSELDAGQEVELMGRAVDAEDGELDPSHLSWDVTLHDSDHTRPWATGLLAQPPLRIPLVVEEQWSFRSS